MKKRKVKIQMKVCLETRSKILYCGLCVKYFYKKGKLKAHTESVHRNFEFKIYCNN